MQRTPFVRSLDRGRRGRRSRHVAPALALDEGAIGHEVFNQLRDDGEMLFDSPYYEHMNEIGRDRPDER